MPYSDEELAAYQAGFLDGLKHRDEYRWEGPPPKEPDHVETVVERMRRTVFETTGRYPEERLLPGASRTERNQNRRRRDKRG